MNLLKTFNSLLAETRIKKKTVIFDKEINDLCGFQKYDTEIIGFLDQKR